MLHLFISSFEGKIDDFEILEGDGIKIFSFGDVRNLIKSPKYDYKILDIIEIYFKENNI